MESSLVSIIVPVFNTKKYLRECLESLLSQSYQNLEILLIDDGSTDGCDLICDDYGSQDKRIRVFHNENGGQAFARNFGMGKALGDYIIFVDSDDVVSPLFVEKLYGACCKFDADIAFSGISLFSKKMINSGMTQENARLIGKNEMFKLYSSPKIKDSIPIISFCNKIFKRTLLQDFSFPEGMAYEDTASIFIPLYNMNRCVFVESNLYFYRKSENSTTNHVFNEKCFDAIKAFKMAIEFFSEKQEPFIVQRLYVPLLMHEIFCWWGYTFILKDKELGGKILNEYQETCKKIKGNANPFIWTLLLKLIGRFPGLYCIYKKINVAHIGDR